MTATLLLASNRGPISWRRDDTGALVGRRGSGGLVSALGGQPLGDTVAWVCAALTDADRAAARTGLAALPGLHLLDIDALTFQQAYNGIANGALWFTAHLLWSLPQTPTFDQRSRSQWAGYQRYCMAFAAALDRRAAPRAQVLVQDYHLALVPQLLRERRPDLRISHFSHTPWAPPEYFALLPEQMATGVLRGMLGADAVGFLSPRWATAFVACCQQLLGATFDGASLTLAGRRTAVAVHPLGVDAQELRAAAASPAVSVMLPALRALVGDRQLLLRIDRSELTKNVVRGLYAYRELLRRFPAHRERVVHLAFAYPSRQEVPAYREYLLHAQRVAAQVNEEFAVPGWQPVLLEVDDDYPRSLAAYTLADVLLVNPVRDGMNLVAKEGPVLSSRGLSLVLSQEAGAADQLGPDAHLVHPLDISQTAEALDRALRESPATRRRRTAALVLAATALPPAAWLQAQRDALPR